MSQNRLKTVLNPLTGDFDQVNDLEMGFTVRNQTKAPFTVLSGYTRVYPNLAVPDGFEIVVEDGGEMISP